MESKEVIYKKECVWICPPDCGTPEDDEYDFVPHCPSCDLKLTSIPRDNYCRKCGQKLDWVLKK